MLEALPGTVVPNGSDWSFTVSFRVWTGTIEYETGLFTNVNRFSTAGVAKEAMRDFVKAANSQ